MMVMIVFNAVLLGVEIDISAGLGQNDIPSWFGAATGTGKEGVKCEDDGKIMENH